MHCTQPEAPLAARRETIGGAPSSLTRTCVARVSATRCSVGYACRTPSGARRPGSLAVGRRRTRPRRAGRYPTGPRSPGSRRRSPRRAGCRRRGWRGGSRRLNVRVRRAGHVVGGCPARGSVAEDVSRAAAAVRDDAVVLAPIGPQLTVTASAGHVLMLEFHKPSILDRVGVTRALVPVCPGI